MYETSLRIPLFFFGFGKSQKRISNYVDHYDTFQTIMDLLGYHNTCEEYPGNSFLKILEGNENISWNNTKYGEYGDLRMIRNETMKLIIRYSNKSPNSFFNLKNDPNELLNIYDNIKDSEEVVNMHNNLNNFYKQYSSRDYSGLNVENLPRHNYGHEAWRPFI